MHEKLSVLLVGYGAMGRAIEAQLVARGHHVVDRIGSHGNPEYRALAEVLATTAPDVAIEFSIPTAALTNVQTLLEFAIPVVSGTTGWNPERLSGVADQHQTPFLHAANFSIGVAVMKRLVANATEILRGFPEFEPAIVERHHRRKRDAPSGTAQMLSEVVRATGDYGSLQVTSLRQGGLAGEHSLFFEGDAESIELTHRAHSRDVFAIGAVRAAEWLVRERPQGRVAFDSCFERNISWTASV